MSYDDGKIYDERLVEIFDKNGIKGTFNINYGLMERDENRVQADRVKELYKNHEVATHCMTHPTIARCPLINVAHEILEDRIGLEKLTGKLVRGHAYPTVRRLSSCSDSLVLLTVVWLVLVLIMNCPPIPWSGIPPVITEILS